MLDAPDAARPHEELTWIGFSESDELGECPSWDRWIHINDKGGAVDACHGRDVTDEIKIEFVIERRIDRAVGEGQQEL